MSQLLKNIDKSTFEIYSIEEDFFCIRSRNESSHRQLLNKEVSLGYLQFHFCLKGDAEFLFHAGNYKLSLEQKGELILYNPKIALPINLQISPNASVLSLVISIKKFHSLFSEEAKYIPFLNAENIDTKYYQQNETSPANTVVLNQLMQFNLHQSVKTLYFKAKIYELLSLLFNKTESIDNKCPFAMDEHHIGKIKKAKEIILSQMYEPPTLTELAEQVGLNVKKLKIGFKQIYGETVYGFLLDYKMDYARKLLDKGSYNVNEVGAKIGYSTASHFIVAFKKKFGTTPKQYILSLPTKNQEK